MAIGKKDPVLVPPGKHVCTAAAWFVRNRAKSPRAVIPFTHGDAIARDALAHFARQAPAS